MYDSVLFLLLLDVCPSLFVLSALLRENEATFFVFESEHKCFNLLADLHNVVRVDIVFDGKFTSRNETFCLVTEFEEHSVAIDFGNCASDKLLLFNNNHGGFELFFEALGEIAVDNLSRGVIVFRIEGAHYGIECCIGQGSKSFEMDRS